MDSWVNGAKSGAILPRITAVPSANIPSIPKINMKSNALPGSNPSRASVEKKSLTASVVPKNCEVISFSRAPAFCRTSTNTPMLTCGMESVLCARLGEAKIRQSTNKSVFVR